MTVYQTKVSAAYIARRQAAQAGGSQVNFLAGQIILGDGNGSVPAISDLVAAGGVIHEVWRGSVITSVTVDSANPAQVDVRAVIPSSVGGFWVREFVITDETGAVCIYGTTLVEKTSAAQGQTSDLSLIAAIAESDTGVVVLSPPSADYATIGAMQTAINGHQPTAEDPLYATDTTSGGWLQRLFKIKRSTQTQIGVERPANDAEFTAGVGSASPWPWATLGQLKGKFDAIATQIAGLGTQIAALSSQIANIVAQLTPSAHWATPGYVNLFGLIIQWGVVTSPPGQGGFNVTFYTTFPTACWDVVGVAHNPTEHEIADVWCQTVSTTTSGARLYSQSGGAIGWVGSSEIRWIAFGW
jgi:hypothetical protein